MGYIPPQPPLPPNWRLDPGLSSIFEYKKKFALWPVKCSDGTKVWFKFYYKKYELWSHTGFGGGNGFNDNEYLHTDFVGTLSEADYIVEKLAGT
jgi:hypothetical protein